MEVIVPENDAGIKYALTRDAKDSAEKYNNAIKRIAAFNKRKGALSKAMKSGQDTTSLEEKIEEFEHSLNLAETERAKSVARLNKLREGGLPVDDYMEVEKVSDNAGAGADWDYQDDNDETDNHHYPATTQHQMQPDAAAWDTQDDWGSCSPVQETAPAAPAAEYTGELAQAIVLYTFDASSHDEMSVREGEWIHVLLSAPEEDGWVTGQNSEGKTGLVPSSFVCQTTPEQYEADQAALAAEQAAPQAALDNWAEEEPAAAVAGLAVPSCPPPVTEDEDSSEEDSQDDDDDGPPPGLAPPPGPPPGLAPSPPSKSESAVAGQYQVLYDFQANADDELTIVAGDIINVLRDGDDEGWFFGSFNGNEGIFPSSYVEKVVIKGNVEVQKNKANEENKSIDGALEQINNLVIEAEEAVNSAEKDEHEKQESLSNGVKQESKEENLENSSDDNEDTKSSATESESEDEDKDKDGSDLR